jgi:hypothetical protein
VLQIDVRSLAVKWRSIPLRMAIGVKDHCRSQLDVTLFSKAILDAIEEHPPRSTDAELEILTVLWSTGPATVRQVYE